MANGHDVVSKAAAHSAAATVISRHSHQVAALVAMHRLLGSVLAGTGARLHLDKDQCIALPGDQIDLAAQRWPAVIPRHDCIPMLTQEPVGEILPCLADRLEILPLRGSVETAGKQVQSFHATAKQAEPT